MRTPALLLCLSLLAACSDAPPEGQGEGSAVAIEKQIEGDAKSLEAAADEAVNVLHSKMEAELKADGFARPVINVPQIVNSQEQESQP